MSFDKVRSKEYWVKLFSFMEDEDDIYLSDIGGNTISRMFLVARTSLMFIYLLKKL